jgi:hypothetical protein
MRIRQVTTSKGPHLVIFFVWLMTRTYHFLGYEIFLATDSKDYLSSATQLSLSNSNQVGLSRSFLYVFLLKIFLSKLICVVVIQGMLSLYTAFLIFKVIKRRIAKGQIPLVMSILFLIFPLTAYFEGQILTETISALLMLKLWESWERHNAEVSTKSGISLVLFSIALALHRPSFLVFIASISLLSLFRNVKLEKGLILKALLPLSISVLLIANFLLLGTFKSGNDALKTGIAMHLVDTFATDAEVSTLSKEISETELVLKTENPSNRFWAIQIGSQNFANSNKEISTAIIGQELWIRTAHLLKQYPLLFLQSVNKSLFSVFTDDSAAFKPGGSFRDFPLRISSLLGFGIFNSLLLGGVYLYLVASLLFGLLKIKYYNHLDLVTLISLFPCLLLHAIISPIEQIRYAFPLMPIILIMFASFVHQVSEITKNR